MAKIEWSRWIRDGAGSLDQFMCERIDGSENRKATDSFDGFRAQDEQAFERFNRWRRTRGKRLILHFYVVIAVLICLGLSSVLIYTAMDLPKFGDAYALVDNEVSRFYVEEGLEHTGAVNIISGIILDFRGFDTLGESHVLFVAACTVLMLLQLPKGDSPEAQRERLEAEANDRFFEPRYDPILETCARLLIPMLMVFGIYVLCNGHLSPGGGFSGGAILGSGMILYVSAFGFKRTQRFLTFRTFRVLTTSALVFYAVSKGYVFFTGANGIESGIGAGEYGRILSGGLMMPLNLAVGMVVACTMYALYALFRKGDM